MRPTNLEYDPDFKEIVEKAIADSDERVASGQFIYYPCYLLSITQIITDKDDNFTLKHWERP